MLIKINVFSLPTDGEFALIQGNTTELEIMVNVSNLADSAYEAQLFIVHQKSVSYIATKKPVSERQLMIN